MLADLVRRGVRQGIPKDGMILEYFLQDGPRQNVVRNTAPIANSIGNGIRFNYPIPYPAPRGIGWHFNVLSGYYGGIDINSPFPHGDFTATMDVMFSSFGSTNQALWVMGDYSAGGANLSASFAIGAYGSTWYVNIGNGVTYWADTSKTIGLTVGVWYKMAIRVVGRSIKMYINGELHREWTAGIDRGTSSIYKGAFGMSGEYRGSGFSNAAMSHIRMWNRGLSEAEIRAVAMADVPAKNMEWNPLKKGANVTLSQNNRIMRSVDADSALGVVGANSGKRMFEIFIYDSIYLLVGVGTENADLGYYPGGSGPNSWGYFTYDGRAYHNGIGYSYGAACTIGDVIGVVVDFDLGELYFYKNGVSQGLCSNALPKTMLYPMAGSGSFAAYPYCFFNTGEAGFAFPISGVDPWN